MAILRYIVRDIIDCADGVRIYTLEAEGERLKYRPGHFTMLHLLGKDGESVDKRPYSIASSPTSDTLEFCIKLVGGRFTSKLEKVKEGDVLGVEGALGHFLFEEEKKAAFIAGGTGIAPFLSILRYVNDKKLEGDYTLFYSARRGECIVSREELEGMSSENPSIKVVFTLTREDPPGWKGEKGRVDLEMVKRHVEDLPARNWYLCGPLKMTTGLRQQLIDNGVPAGKIKFEGWG